MFQENSIKTCILSRVKQITSPGWMHETSARTWGSGKTWRERVEREVGGGIGMGKTCKPKAVSFQCMTKFTTKKKKKLAVVATERIWAWELEHLGSTSLDKLFHLFVLKFGYPPVLLVFVLIQFWFTFKGNKALLLEVVLWKMNHLEYVSSDKNLSFLCLIYSLAFSYPHYHKNTVTPSWILWEPKTLWWNWLG